MLRRAVKNIYKMKVEVEEKELLDMEILSPSKATTKYHN